MKYWFIFCKSDLLLEQQVDGTFTIPLAEDPPFTPKPWETIHDITPMADGTPVSTFAVSMPPTIQRTPTSSFVMCGLRQSFQRISHELYLKAGKCQEILYWDQNTRYCGVCGSPMKLHTSISKRCPQCGKEVWPQLATAVIVLIHRGDEVLLVRARNFRGDFYGLVAGFVETGESLEEAVVREVAEETGLRIKNIRYFGSQPWPYPSGLMVGYHADYDGGDLHLQHSELMSGGWFRRDNLPTIPEKLSIARRLLDDWLDKS